jgi:uncharacterized tellurite resistance protein B-like protein
MMRKFMEKYMAEPEVSGQDEAERLRIATCVLLVEAAKTDEEFSAVEEDIITEILQKEFQLSQEAVKDLMEIAHAEREESVDVYEFTRLINRHYSREEKMKIMEFIWHVIYADARLDKYEDYLAHKLGKLLRLHHHEMIDAKLTVLAESED